MILPPWAPIVGGALALALAFGAGWQVRAWKAGSDDLKQTTLTQAAIDAQRRVADTAAMAMEDSRAAIEKRSYDTQTIIRETYREIPVPAECAVPVAVADSLRQSVEETNRAVSGEPPRAVPAPARSAGPPD